MDNTENAERSSFLSSQEVAIGLLLLIGFPFFFIGGPGYHAERSFKSAWDLGHVLFFFLATRLFLLVAAKRQKTKQRPFFFLQVFVSALGLGILIELAQKALGGRSVDGWDVYRDLLGCAGAYTVSELFPVINRRFVLPAIGIMLLVTTASWPLVRSLVDENIARRQFPVLADFETPFEQNRFIPGSRLRRVEKVAAHGRFSLRVQLTTATYSGASLFYFPHDWRGYTTLNFSVYNPDKQELPLHCRIHDVHHRQHGMRFSDRFHQLFALHPGWNRCQVSLADVRTAPRTRLMDMAHIESFAFFVVRQRKGHIIYVDNVYLGR